MLNGLRILSFLSFCACILFFPIFLLLGYQQAFFFFFLFFLMLPISSLLTSKIIKLSAHICIEQWFPPIDLQTSNWLVSNISLETCQTADVQAPSSVILISNSECIPYHLSLNCGNTLVYTDHKSRKKQCNAPLHHPVQQLLTFCWSFSCTCSFPPLFFLNKKQKVGPTGQIQLAASF